MQLKRKIFLFNYFCFFYLKNDFDLKLCCSLLNHFYIQSKALTFVRVIIEMLSLFLGYQLAMLSFLFHVGSVQKLIRSKEK